MYVILSDESGEKTEGILLAASPGCLRIVIRKLTDTMELRLKDGRWMSEDGKAVDIECLISDGETGCYAPFVPLTRTGCN